MEVKWMCIMAMVVMSAIVGGETIIQSGRNDCRISAMKAASSANLPVADLLAICDKK